MPARGRTDTLAAIPLFKSLSAAAIAKLDTQCTWRRATAGQWLLDYQDASNDVFFVVAGVVRVILQSGGREVLFRELKAGEFFGELAVLDREPRSADAVCAEDTSLLRLRSADLGELMARRPQIQEGIMIVLVRKIRALNQRLSL